MEKEKLACECNVQFFFLPRSTAQARNPLQFLRLGYKQRVATSTRNCRARLLLRQGHGACAAVYHSVCPLCAKKTGCIQPRFFCTFLAGFWVVFGSAKRSLKNGLILARFTLARPILARLILARFTLARLVSALGGRIFTDSMRFNYPQDCFACIALCLSLHP